ncbi:MAG: 50S ribosomal protein L24 [Proteobacteria bacterium]|nr:50S ribosomal protein L24 [Pseudomonadota bacterium]
MAQTTLTKYQEKFRLKKGDEVVILTGKAKGGVGKIDRVDFKKNAVFVAGQNVFKKHTRSGANGEEGGIIDKVMPIHISNVRLVDPKTKKPTGIAYKLQNGEKVRVAKVSKTVLA